MHIHQRWRLVCLLAIALAFAVLAQAQHAAAAPKHTPPAPARPTVPPAKPTLLGQFGDWGAYTASPDGKKLCYAIAKPTSSETKPSGRPRNPAYMIISTRPNDKVTDEVSIIIGYPFKPGTESTVEVGGTTFNLYTQGDGAWIKSREEEAHMVEAMRGGEKAVVKGVSTRGTQTTDSYSLKGFSQALERADQECKAPAH